MHSVKCSCFVTLSLAALLIAGCNSTPTKVNSGTIHAATFSFVDPGTKAAPDFADNRQQMNTMIQDAITRNLASKGLTKVASGGDVTVAYLVIIGNNVSTVAIHDYFGYGRDFAALQDKAQNAYAGSKNPDYFQAGTLLVDIIEGKSYKLLKRSYVTRPLLKNPTADVQAQRLQEAVDEVLSGVQITR
jgi:hypothetical protein